LSVQAAKDSEFAELKRQGAIKAESERLRQEQEFEAKLVEMEAERKRMADSAEEAQRAAQTQLEHLEQRAKEKEEDAEEQLVRCHIRLQGVIGSLLFCHADPTTRRALRKLTKLPRLMRKRGKSSVKPKRRHVKRRRPRNVMLLRSARPAPKPKNSEDGKSVQRPLSFECRSVLSEHVRLIVM
jgi:seryl-tRNA synthetase